jgi:hypothetical protein
MFTIFRTKKPLADSKSTIVGKTTNLETAQDIADKANRSELKHLSKDKLTVKGNREITEIFNDQEILDVIESFKNGQIAP